MTRYSVDEGLRRPAPLRQERPSPASAKSSYGSDAYPGTPWGIVVTCRFRAAGESIRLPEQGMGHRTDDQGDTMGTRVHLTTGDPYAEATALELWAAGELHDEAGSRGLALEVEAMIGFLLALAAFFVAFAPGV